METRLNISCFLYDLAAVGGPSGCKHCVKSDAASCTQDEDVITCATDKDSLGITHCGSAVGKYRNETGQEQGARSIKPQFPEIPVQNEMERNISKNLFRKFRSTSRGCPFSRKLGNTGNFLFHLPFHHQIDLPDSPRRFLVSYPPQKGQYLLFGCNGWSPMWISHRYATSLDNSLAEKFARFPCHPKTIFKLMSSRQIPWNSGLKIIVHTG